MAIAYYGEGKFREIGPANWDTATIWGRSFRRVREVDFAGFTAIYAVVCPLGETHHYLVQEGGRVDVVELTEGLRG
jgi:hypothetical protein